MNTPNRPSLRWGLLSLHLGVVIFMMACAVFGGAQQSDDGQVQFDDGNIEVQGGNGGWVPVDGASFELVGVLESTDPWTVAGTELETRESTLIEAGLEIGGLVRVRGVILEDDTWVAYSIEGMDGQTDPIIVLIGVVDSVNPWVVNGIQLNVTDETDIQGEITTGMIVRVEILLLEDGTWDVLSIAPLGNMTEAPGCVTVIATVLSVDGTKIQFLGWPTTVIIVDHEQTEDDEDNDNEGNEDSQEGNDEDEDDENEDDDDEKDDDDGQIKVTIKADQVVLAVVCISDDGQLIIVQIVILEDDRSDDNGDTADGDKVLVCHKPSKNGHTLSISSSAVPAHLGHGDTLGPCP